VGALCFSRPYSRARRAREGPVTADWVPAFEGQRPPFEPGNQVSVGNRSNLTHGVYMPRMFDPLAKELVDLVLEDPELGYLTSPRWRPALWAWARAEAQVQLATEYLARDGELSYDGMGDLDESRIVTAELLLHRAEARATTGRTRLGLDPLSAARLGRDRAAASVDIARVMQEFKRRDDAAQAHGELEVLDVDGDEV
jgi:hypothetical protein